MSWFGNVAGSIASTAGGTLMGNLVNQAFAKKNAERNWKYQVKGANLSYELDKKMWDEMNAYNTPAAQMARLEQAGLNPAMMYGTGQGANVSKEYPKYNNPSVNYDAPIINPFQVLGAYADLKVKNAQADNIEAATETRRLENQLRTSTLKDKIDMIASQTYDAKMKALLNELKLNVTEQMELSGLDENAVKDQPGVQYLSTQKKNAELSISQEAARRTRAEADIKEQEASLYRLFQGLFKDNNKAGSAVKGLSAVMKFLGSAIITKMR